MPELDVFQAEVSKSEDQIHWTCSLELANIEDYARFAQDASFTLELFGEQWAFIVDSKELQRSGPAGRRFQLNGVSPTAMYDLPRAEPYSVTYSIPVFARAAAEAALGTTIDWQIVDWLIPAYRLVADNASPLAFAARIVEAAGGVLESKKDGTFLARHRFPVSTQNYETATPDHAFSELDKIVSVREQFVPGKIVNRIRISDQDANFLDRIEFVADEGDPSGLSGELRVYPSPWRTEVRLVCTSDISDVRLQENAPRERTRVVTEEEDGVTGELVEFRNSEANTGYPIDSIDSVEWISASLGSVTFEPNSTTLRSSSPTEGYGLARVVYRTRYLSYDAQAFDVTPAQFILEDIG